MSLEPNFTYMDYRNQIILALLYASSLNFWLKNVS